MQTIQLKLESIRSIFENQQAGFKNLGDKCVRPIQLGASACNKVIQSKTSFILPKPGKESYIHLFYLSFFCSYSLCYSWYKCWICSSGLISWKFYLSIFGHVWLHCARQDLRLALLYSSDLMQPRGLPVCTEYSSHAMSGNIYTSLNFMLVFQQAEEGIWNWYACVPACTRAFFFFLLLTVFFGP